MKLASNVRFVDKKLRRARDEDSQYTSGLFVFHLGQDGPRHDVLATEAQLIALSSTEGFWAPAAYE